MTPDDKGWHLTRTQVTDYVGERSTVAQAASVETHLTACDRCRSMLDGMLPDLPIDRMWQQILVTVDRAPSGRFRRAVERIAAQWSPASFAPAALRPQLIVLAACALLIGLALAVQPAHRPAGRGDASSVAAPETPTRAPGAPSALQVRGAAGDYPGPGPEAASNAGGGPVASYDRKENPRAGIPASPPRFAVAPKTRRAARDRIPWRAGCHPD